jgi:hypothetical protein
VGFAPIGYFTVSDAADKLGVSPWDVLRLVQDGHLSGVTLVDADSLTRYQKGEAS